MGTRFHWRDREVTAEVEERLKDALGELGLMCEGEAKKELYEGHGVDTGALRASIHAAEPRYPWTSDNMPGVREMGGRKVRGARVGNRIVVEVGSGMEYAIWVHQGHHSFGGYHYLTNAVEKIRPYVAEVLKKHQVME